MQNNHFYKGFYECKLRYKNKKMLDYPTLQDLIIYQMNEANKKAK